ncbi:MAG: ATP phosphoribosyltransferase regulatory subunit [Alphaproteobacteria bacterium]|nr:ATP phosphoribosyltransferase regulatory subunit [Alphaproteobacteria bacterium]
MKQKCGIGLLPVGMNDVLFPLADKQAKVVEKILDVFQDFGYQRVTPTLAEFEQTLFVDNQEDLKEQTFRLIDPISSQLLGIRADMTPQISRIALTRLNEEPRPLRLAYSGDVLRLKGSMLHPNRQILQAGAELIGADSSKCDAEVILLILEALHEVKVDNVSVDLNLPPLLPSIFKEFKIEGNEADNLLSFIGQKDFSNTISYLKKISNNNEKILSVFELLLGAYGEAEDVLNKLDKIEFKGEALAEIKRLKEVCEILKENNPRLKLSIDVLENRGFEYHKGVSFSVYEINKGILLGQGGRYISSVNGLCGEPSTGATLIMENVLSVVSFEKKKEKVLLQSGVNFEKAKEIINSGKQVVFGIDRGNNGEKELIEQAKSLKCDYVYFKSGEIRSVF